MAGETATVRTAGYHHCIRGGDVVVRINILHMFYHYNKYNRLFINMHIIIYYLLLMLDWLKFLV